MAALCPVCQQVMEQVSDHFHCSHCHGHYRQEAECPDCGKPLQVLKACGAVDYFCQHGHGLISKSRVHYSYLPRV
ncbi:Protein of uncharacterised function (DUF1407) [Yersinia rohdei]|uniref:zinc ribbon domain-containing protein n=1 Tax=Yersinia rohdei TaxID=29485 RepID=UPI0005DF8A19|nr:zinc ribbon domain-containing protein [Yersinia rohdei]MDN0096267.1 zinc ribbon domain-containing protein [Yersinia rohdei]OWF77650.1 primosomal protein N' (replication factor Y) - superfamily II helicase [Yersinia rohdei]CNF25457.1 Protein of uncharacterised function (DUF1407) [Yersinia rohdei]CNJ44665.1 Protein of uncharacterised function (DUF1407) [Yersinia rohdei]CQJ61657.1 Protein of uncharacterised function (DUF1407) [Yersinia rohdei]